MAIVPLRAWYLEHYEPIQDIEARSQDLRLSKNSLLKSALRADFLDDTDQVKTAPWFARYLEGETIEFYIEGSGSYAIANLDLTSHEIYFVKRDATAHLDPTIFLSHQTEFPETSQLLAETLEAAIADINPRLRFPLRLIKAHRPPNAPLKLNATLLRQIRRSLLFVADATAIAKLPGEPPALVLSPKVCLETGYALHAKKAEQLLLIQQRRAAIAGEFPFDLMRSQHAICDSAGEVAAAVEEAIDLLVGRFKLA